MTSATADGLRVTLLGFTVPDELIDEVLALDREMPVQTHAFAWGLVDALSSAGCEVTLVSALPASTFPRNRRIRFRGGRFNARGIDGDLLAFVNLLGVKHVTGFLSACRTLLSATRRRRTQVILIHGVHSPFLWSGLLVRRLRGPRVVPVLTDPPGVTLPGEGFLTGLLRRTDVALVRLALRHCDGVVALTPALADDFAPGRPSIVMEGILSTPPPDRTVRRDRVDRFDIAYAGRLTRAYGVDRLIEAVRAMDDPEVRLRLFGRGELDEWVREQTAQDDRICVPQFLGRQALADQLSVADVLVNPRPIDFGQVRYTFPSKLIEYLSLGVPVVTTKLPSIPLDYRSRLVLAENDTVEGLRRALVQVRAMPARDAQVFGASGAAFIRATRSRQAQGTKLWRFLSTIAGDSARTRIRGLRTKTAHDG
jgi:glycosyltransferase involved in cell wall biosynthesis